MNMKIKSFALSATTLAFASMWGMSMAQNAPVISNSSAAGDVQRSIEDAQNRLPVKPAMKASRLDLPDTSDSEPLSRLDAVVVQGSRLRPEIEAYWAGMKGMPVSAAQVSAFKAWVNATARANGFMAFAQTVSRGTTLEVSLVVPRINSVKVFARDEVLARQYLADVQALFSKRFGVGSEIDPIYLEHQLDAISFTKPLELEMAIRPVGPELLDLVIDVTEAPYRAAQVLSGLVQLNNYGLKQYGVEQLLGQVTIGGHVPSARLTATAQKSNNDGINYLRAEYDMPVDVLDSRFHIAVSNSQSKGVLPGSANVKSESTDLVMGFERIMGYRGDLVVKGVADVSTRSAKSRLAANDQEISRVKDDQLRLRLSVDNDRLSVEPMRAEVSVVQGFYDTLIGYTNVSAGKYSKLEFNARKQLNLSEDGQWFALGRLRGQFVSQQVDASNRLSMGGVNGVRAYTSVDGVGDDVMLASLDVNYRYSQTHSAGVFYDGGVMRVVGTPAANAYDAPYKLQSLGVQLNGNFKNWYYVFAVAKGIGGNNGALPTDTESSPDNWRANGALTYFY